MPVYVCVCCEGNFPKYEVYPHEYDAMRLTR